MIKQFLEKKEKKVEYAELVYDLIFVYISKCTISMMHHTVGGAIPLETFLIFIACTLAVIQIWTYTTYYINAYGKNGARDHVLLFSNMFLMYFLARGTQSDWQDQHTVFHIAWALILVNIGVHYLIERHDHRGDSFHTKRIDRMVMILFIEAVIVALAIAEFNVAGSTSMSLFAILFGIGATQLAGRYNGSQLIDFEHFSERAMLYVVLTFGEMIIAIAGYFDGEITPRSLYFALMGFLIVVGLFLSYGVFYDRIIDRERQTNGLSYMLIHIFLIFALNNITASLEFMRDDEMDILLKISFMTVSLILYFVFLFMTGRYARRDRRLTIRFYLTVTPIAVLFAALMYLFRAYNMVHIALTVAFVFGVFGILKWNVRKAEQT